MDKGRAEQEEGRGNELILEDDNGSDFKVYEINGMVFPMPFFKSEAEILKRFSYVKCLPYKPDDVLLCSYPKTGAHWITSILHYLMSDGNLDDMVSYPPCMIDFFDSEGEVQREGNRLLLSHFLPKYLPEEHFANGGKTILLFRKPKDTLVSMYHMMQKQKTFGDYQLTWDGVFKYWLQGKIPMGSYFDYYNSWQMELDHNPNLDILIVQYEDLKMNGLGEVRRIQKYLGLNHSDERLEAVLSKCSIENLKADVESGKVQTRLVDEKGMSVILRKGIIGDWKNHFTVAQNEKFEAVVNEKLNNSIFNYKT